MNAPDQRGNTPMHYAADNRELEIVKLLVENGAELNALDATKWTPLHYAIFGQLEMVNYLLKSGADINALTYNKWTPLHYASWCGYLKVVKQLVAGGAHIVILNKDG